MQLFILIVFCGLVAVFSILLDRRWQRRALPRPQEPPSGPRVPLPVPHEQNTSLVDQLKTGWQKRMGWHAQSEVEQPKLRVWLLTHLAEHPTAQSWVAGLSDAEFSALCQQLQAFCAALQIDLAWLGGQPLAKDPALQATVHATVLYYVQAQQQAVGVQAHLSAFKTYPPPPAGTARPLPTTTPIKRQTVAASRS